LKNMSKIDISETAHRAGSVIFSAGIFFSKKAAGAGNLITRGPYAILDKTRFGAIFHEHANKLCGPIACMGDTGYIGYAVEQGSKTIQLSGALGTLPANAALMLFGDVNPLSLTLIDKAHPSSTLGLKTKAKARAAAEYVIDHNQYVLPAAWLLLAYNGFSLAASAVTKHADINLMLHSTAAILPQVLEVLPSAPEFLQGVAILIGCSCLAANQYLKHSKKNASQQVREAARALANDFGTIATGFLTMGTLMTATAALADRSPSLVSASVAFFFVNYCQYQLSKTKSPEAASSNPPPAPT
jgi:hypothetical protein